MTKHSAALLGYVVLVVLMSAGAAQSLAGSNTVFSDDITDGNVRNADIGNNQISSGKIKDGQVLNADLGNSSVSGIKILDGSITGADLKRDALHAVGPFPIDGDLECTDGTFCSDDGGVDGFQNYGSPWRDVAYTKSAENMVTVEGLAKLADPFKFADAVNVLVLPAGYRPSKDLVFSAMCSTAAGKPTYANINVRGSGLVDLVQNAAGDCDPGGWLSLSGITFKAEQ